MDQAKIYADFKKAGALKPHTHKDDSKISLNYCKSNENYMQDIDGQELYDHNSIIRLKKKLKEEKESCKKKLVRTLLID